MVVWLFLMLFLLIPTVVGVTDGMIVVVAAVGGVAVSAVDVAIVAADTTAIAAVAATDVAVVVAVVVGPVDIVFA